MIAWLLLACDPSPRRGPSTIAPAAHQLRLERVHIERWENDELRHRIRAAEVVTDRVQGQVRAKDVSIVGYRAGDGAPAARATSNEAEGHWQNEQVRLSGDVKITDRSGRRMRTQRADYDGRTSRLVAPGPVTIEGENFTVHGASGVADVEGDTVELTGPVRATVGD